jgi:hypothetical protein
MRPGTAYLDVDFAIPPQVNMKFVSTKASEGRSYRDADELEIAWRRCRSSLDKKQAAN